MSIFKTLNEISFLRISLYIYYLGLVSDDFIYQYRCHMLIFPSLGNFKNRWRLLKLLLHRYLVRRSWAIHFGRLYKPWTSGMVVNDFLEGKEGTVIIPFANLRGVNAPIMGNLSSPCDTTEHGLGKRCKWLVPRSCRSSLQHTTALGW